MHLGDPEKVRMLLYEPRIACKFYQLCAVSSAQPHVGPVGRHTEMGGPRPTAYAELKKQCEHRVTACGCERDIICLHQCPK